MRSARASLVVATALALAVCCAAGCSPKESTDSSLGPVRIGYVASEDCLPLWVAQRDGGFEDAGLDAKLQEYPSARERDAGLAAGQIDAAVGDVVSAVRLRTSGTPVRIATVMLGATPAEGRYGIAVKPRSAVTSLVGLARKPVGTSTGTMEEYVFESLMLFDGLGPVEIKAKPVSDVASRFDALAAGELEAALLPEPYLSLAEKRGAKVISQDTHDVNLSFSVLVVSERYLDTSDGSVATAKLLEVLEGSSKAIDEDPASFRALLAERIPALKPVENTYRVSRYPGSRLPSLEDAEAVLDWMTQSGLLKEELLYESLVWTPPAK